MSWVSEIQTSPLVGHRGPEGQSRQKGMECNMQAKAVDEQVAKKPLRGAAKRILEAATELFHERGIRAVSVDEIVRRAGATKPSLYHRFASKDGLVAACLEQIAEEAKAELDARMIAAGEDPRAQFRALVARFEWPHRDFADPQCRIRQSSFPTTTIRPGPWYLPTKSICASAC